MSTIKKKDFVHWHVHSEYSVFDGNAKMDKLVQRARAMGQQGLCLTDHGTVAGQIRFFKECNKEVDKKGNPLLMPDGKTPLPKITPGLGMEAYLAKSHLIRQPEGRKGNRHLVLIAKNWKGYQNLCRLSEMAYVEGFFHSPRIDIEQLARHSEGLICSSACLSSVVNANLLHDRYDYAKQVATIFKDIFKEDFFLEVMYHGIDAEAAIVPDIFKLGSQLEIPIIATNDVHYIEKSQARSHEVLMAMSSQKCIHDPKRYAFPYPEFYLKSAEEMWQIWGSKPEVLYNTLAVLERIDAKDIKANMGGMRLPKFEIPPQFKDAQDYLEYLAWEGMKKIGWTNSPAHVEALKKELRDVHIAKLNNNYDFATYFLIVRDYVDFALQNKILTGPGRGSGYASVLLRTLGITYGPDPLKYDLLWERFLGFDDKWFIKESDFGFSDEKMIIEKDEEDQEEDLDEDRDLEDDLGGVDRY